MNDYPGSTRGSSDAMMGFLMGTIVGAGIALLFAPAPGSDTRRRVGETASRLGSAAKEKFGETASRVGSAAKEKFSEIKEDLKQRRAGASMDNYGAGMENEFRQS